MEILQYPGYCCLVTSYSSTIISSVPDLFSYIQVFADNSNQTGKFILTGSQDFLLLEKISQSLAGRVAILNLLPFQYQKLKNWI